jgi:hypothetical protein
MSGHQNIEKPVTLHRIRVANKAIDKAFHNLRIAISVIHFYQAKT